jgi:hypothetical protein
MMTPVELGSAQQPISKARLNFSNGDREAHLHAFYEWLPKDLHAAPGIVWANVTSRVMGYCVNTIGASPDKGPVALAMGTAIGSLGQASLHQYVSRFYHLLCTIRNVCGIRDLSELNRKEVWEQFAQNTEVTLNRYHVLRAYAALVEKHVRF